MLCVAWIIPFVVGAFIHLSGMVGIIAPALGNIGTILKTTDNVVADVTGVRNYIAKQQALHAVKKLHPVVIPKKAPKKP